MNIHDVEQGSPEWLRLRLAIPTASNFDKILTPAELKPSSQAPVYRNQLLAEYVLGYPIDWGGSSQFMERGTELEPEARAWFEFDRDVEVEAVGFVTRDDGLVGGSPDGLIEGGGILEIKCPGIHTHIGYLLDPASLAKAYHGQVQGYLYLAEREWAEIISYNPELPAVVVRVEWDAAYITALAGALDTFIADLIECREKLEPHRAATARAA